MLKKLLKYDMRAVSKYWWIGAVISVAAAIAGGVFIRFFMYVVENTENTENVFLILSSVFCLIAGILCVIAISLSFVFTMVLVFVRFYKHFFTDEGYLTFTLPVKRSTHLLSKTVNAAIWFSAHFAVIVMSLLLFLLLIYPPEEDGFFINFKVFEEIGGVFADAWSGVGPWLIVYILEALLIAFVYLMFSILMVHFCITFGSVLVKKAKLILSIGIYYAFSSCLSVIWQFGMFLFRGLMYEGMTVLMEDATLNQTCAICALLILVITAAIAALSAILYSATQYMIDRKLNLA